MSGVLRRLQTDGWATDGEIYCKPIKRVTSLISPDVSRRRRQVAAATPRLSPARGFSHNVTKFGRLDAFRVTLNLPLVFLFSFFLLCFHLVMTHRLLMLGS